MRQIFVHHCTSRGVGIFDLRFELVRKGAVRRPPQPSVERGPSTDHNSVGRRRRRLRLEGRHRSTEGGVRGVEQGDLQRSAELLGRGGQHRGPDYVHDHELLGEVSCTVFFGIFF
jgi:hypothetical protein